MFGFILAEVIKITTLPIDAVNATADIMTGGDGSKASRNNLDNPLAAIEQIRDKVAEAAEDIDK